MKIERVLVAVKRSTFDRLRHDLSPEGERLRRMVEDGDPAVNGVRASHDEHMASLDTVRGILERQGIQSHETTQIPRDPIGNVDLIIAVGGDGMVLGVSHAVRSEVPILAVNSSPSFSVGYLSACVPSGLEATLGDLRTGAVEPKTVQRLQIEIDGRAIPEPVLNDVLFCTHNPAVMCRYRLEWPDGHELQRSSGVWVSTPAGSTCALSSAGGPVLPLTAQQFAFLVREPYSPPGKGVFLRSAVLARSEELHVQSRTPETSVFLDGSHRQYEVPYGHTVVFRLHPQPLSLVRP